MRHNDYGFRGHHRNDEEKPVERLVRSLGRDGAAQACRENLWHGWLNQILSGSAPGKTPR